MLTLKDLVELTEVGLGQVLIPVSAFGYSYAKLEKLFLESVKFFEKFYPRIVETSVNLSPSGVLIPEATTIAFLRSASNYNSETTYKLSKNIWQWFPDTKLLKSRGVMSTPVDVTYLSHYTMGTYPVIDEFLYNLYSTEDEFALNIKGHFKKGTLKISLCPETEIFESTFIVDPILDTITIDSNTGQNIKTGLAFRFKTTDTLPTGLDLTNTFYVIKVSDTTLKISSSYQNALNNIFLDLTDLGTGTHYIYSYPFEMSEIVSSYKEFTSTFTVNTTDNTLLFDDFMFSKRVTDGSEVFFRNTGGSFPTPITLGTKYYLYEVDTNLYKLCTTPENVILGIFVDLTSLGTGITTIVTLNNPEDDEDRIIHLSGDLGSMEVNPTSLEGIFYNSNGLDGVLKMSFVNKYMAVKELGLDTDYHEFFLTIFKQKFAEGLGRQKMTVKLDGLPVDITADDLLGAQQDLAQKVQEYTESKGRWWIFG